ncbi:DsbE family thiol:disulfide interchange protein [Vibrio cortegadensis]|uniref:DsbE family thiol:disulfide interchange protein n=1 Tax=Vibrio cortegadensis TaxID=1328770 RepID=UPI0021C3A697|nr:DsbE family thiol:disulfide interchange protein [Vibrio cortegadensis]MDN3698190.1 DsbE family thiol:disulfide interchange protein [Vibrio cortegadensis]
MQNKTKLKIGVLFLVMCAFIGTLTIGLSESQSSKSVSVNKPLPEFMQADLRDSQQVLTKVDVLTENVQLLNVWASWCGVCKSEHEFLKELKDENINIIGLNYRDDLKLANNMLLEEGDPYRRIIFDPRGEFALDLGVIGTPESYLINRDGIIIKKYRGALTRDIWNQEFKRYFNN